MQFFYFLRAEYLGYVQSPKITLRKKIYNDVESLQKDLDEWVHYYNNERTHQGKMCCGRTPIETLTDGKKIWQEKSFN